MKIFNKNSTITVLAVAFVLGLILSIPARATGPTTVNLGTAGNFVILSKTLITTTGATSIIGDIGVSPAAATFIQGFGLILDGSGTFSTSALVNGKVYAANYTAPTPATMTAAISAMEAAYTDASGRPTPDGTDLYAGIIGSQTFTPGLYKWTTNVTIPTDITLSGGANDVWIFQIDGTLDISVNKKVILTGGAKASNIFWAVAGTTTLKPGSTFEGNILAGPGASTIAGQSGATLHGRALGQTEVTLIANTVSIPAILHVIKHVITDNGGTADASDFTMNVTGTNVSNPSFVGAEGGTTVTLDAGSYSVDENVFSGYTKSLGANCSGTIAAGDTKTCTITNDDNDPTTATLHVIKKVTNDNDGTSTATDFNLYVKLSGTNVTGSPAIGIVSPGRSYTLAPGTYVVSEDADSTYTSSFSGACDSSGSVTLIAGNDYSCTITNDDIAETVSDETDDEDDKDVDIKVTKKANPSVLHSGPGSITYTYKVTNEGDVPLIHVSVKDDKCSFVEYVSGDKNHNKKLGVDEVWKYTCTKTVSRTETNTATARGSGNGKVVRDTDRASVSVSVPGFPSAGVGPLDESSVPWNIFISTAEFFIAFFSFDLARKKLAIVDAELFLK